MKTKLLFGMIVDKLPGEVKDIVHALAKEHGLKTDTLGIKRRCQGEEKEHEPVCEDGSRTCIQYVSARTLDRDNEIVVPKGMVLKEFLKYRHVLWGHNYSIPPVGADDWIEVDDYGLRAKTRYADTGPGTLADVVWKLKQQGILRASSIGFVPLAWTQPGHNDFDKVLARLIADWPELAKAQAGKDAPAIRRIITKGVLLEHSDVSVPSNPDTDVLSVAKGFGADAKMLGMFKTVYFNDDSDKWEYPVGQTIGVNEVDETGQKAVAVLAVDCPWDANREKARFLDLDDETKSALGVVLSDGSRVALLHHNSRGDNVPVVRQGLRAALCELLDPVTRPTTTEDDWSRAVEHLAAHFKQLDEPMPPVRKDYAQAELDAIFPDVRPSVALKPYPSEHTARINSPDKYQRIRRENDKFGKGVNVVWGVLANGTVEVQAIRFDAGKFTAAEAREWLKEHDYKPILFEPAKEEGKGLDRIVVPVRRIVKVVTQQEPLETTIEKTVRKVIDTAQGRLRY